MSDEDTSPRMPGGNPFGPPLTPEYPPRTPIRGKPIPRFSLASDSRASPATEQNSPSSPTGTVRSSASLTSARPTPPSRGAFGSRRSGFGTPLATLHSGSLAIRSDPSIATSFDPSDKELYDLWAPKP